MKIRIVTDLPEQNLVSTFNLNLFQPTYKVTFTHNFCEGKIKGKTATPPWRGRGKGKSE